MKLLLSIFGGSILLLVIVFVAQVVINKSTSNPTDITSNNTQSTKEDRRRIRRVTMTKDDGSCIEIGADAVVKTYEDCGDALTTIHRLSDPKRVIELMEYVSRLDLSKFRAKPVGLSVRLIVETNTGTEIVYIPVNSGPDSITDIIDLIQGDLPQATPTPGPTSIPTPTLPGTTPIPTLTPTATTMLGYTPTPTIQGQIFTFTCEYAQDGTVNRPYYVSQVICSTQPSPAP